MITVLMKQTAQYSLDGIMPSMLLSGETYEVPDEAWNYLYANDFAQIAIKEKAIEASPEDKQLNIKEREKK